MQGFTSMLKAVGIDPAKQGEQEKKLSGLFQVLGIDPQQMLTDAKGLLDAFDAKRAVEVKTIMDKLESIDKAIKSLDPDYVAEDFQLGEFVIYGEHVQPLTNPDTPDGGPVDPDSLEPDKLAEAGMEPAAGAKIEAKASQTLKPPKSGGKGGSHG